VRLCCGLRLPPPSQKPQRPNQYVYKNGCPLLPLQHSKKPHGRGKQSLSRTVLEKRWQNFGAGKILPISSGKNKKSNDVRGGNKSTQQLSFYHKL